MWKSDWRTLEYPCRTGTHLLCREKSYLLSNMKLSTYSTFLMNLPFLLLIVSLVFFHLGREGFDN
jgi:hypothetical protein